MTDTLTLPDRRQFLGYFSSIGMGSTLLPGVLWGKIAAGAEITTQTIAAAEEIAGVSFTDEERAMMVGNLKSQKSAIDALHKLALDNSVAPVLIFEPVPPGVVLPAARKRPMALSIATCASNFAGQWGERVGLTT